MKKVLFILGEFSDGDIDWLVATGKKQQVPAGTVLIQEGVPLTSLFIVLDGKLGVSVSSLGDKEVARLGAGEVVGEMSLVDERPPSATVRALEGTTVLVIPKAQIMAKMQQDMGFAARFYRALTVFLSDRLRSTVSSLGYGKGKPMDESVEYEDELDPAVLDKVSLAGARFDWLLSRLRGA